MRQSFHLTSEARLATDWSQIYSSESQRFRKYLRNPQYCHVLGKDKEFGLITGFTGLLELVTTKNYSALALIHALYNSLQHALNLLASQSVAWQRIPQVSSASVPRSLPGGNHITTGPHSQSYFTTRGLPPISLSCRQALSDSRPDSFFFFCIWTLAVIHSPYVTSSLTRGWIWLLWLGLAFVNCTYRIYSILLKILPFALYTSTLSVQVFETRLCLPYLSYAITAAYLLERS
jgi:hypothetical protein